MKENNTFTHRFEQFASYVTRITGSSSAFLLALLAIVIWVVTGPIFNFSDTWQLVINTGTTIITFLMVFIIQKAQNKDSLAVQAKLNELIAATVGASNRLLNVEDLTEEELRTLHRYFVILSEKAEKEDSLLESHSVEEAEERHEEKHQITRKRQEKHKQ